MPNVSYEITMIPHTYDSEINIIQKIEDKVLDTFSCFMSEITQINDSYNIYNDIKFNVNTTDFSLRVYSNVNNIIWNDRTYTNGTLIFSMDSKVERTEIVKNSATSFPINITANKGGNYEIDKKYASTDAVMLLTIKPNSGFQISQVISDVEFQDKWELGFESTNNLFTMPAAAVNIEIVFKQIVPHQGKIMINGSQKYFIYTAGSKCNVYKDGKRFI